MQPDNAIMGDATGIDLPQAEPDLSYLADEKNRAKFSKTKEYKKLKEYIEERIATYQSFLPNGLEVGLDVVPSPEDWRVANRVIGELRAVLRTYELPGEVLDESRGA